jgi:NAD(P)-dependent dehydrogenase (short-subunit alcohol dehydrogenase family)
MTDTKQSQRSVLVVGATRGLGAGLTDKYLREGWRVVATTIEPSKTLDALQREHGEALAVLPLDITNAADLQALHKKCSSARFDVLHVVAGVLQKSFAPIWEQSAEEILRVLNTNAIGAIRLAELLAPRVPRGGVVAFTSSGMGSMTRNDQGDVDLYRISKASLNMLVRSFAARHANKDWRVLLLCPGWAKTDMGGPDANVEVSTSVDGMFACITQPRSKPGDGAVFFEYSGAIVPW